MSSDTALYPSPAAADGFAPVGPVAPEPSRQIRVPTLTGNAPARPTPAAAFHSVSAVTTVLLALVAIGAMIHEPVLIPPLAASAALVHSAPTLPLAQPRGVVLGHLLGAGVGYGVLALAGGSAWAAAVAAGVTLALLMLARTPHSAACATSVIVVLQAPAPGRFLPLLFGSTVLLVLTGYAASRVRRKAPKYPAYWW
ncbi:HPP family protein [Streptomyces sp. A1136]|uniref:HPP family protein n=2 Tax=unclassified Streptomyces TaxID=2593676 RepID=UPI00109E48B3|nr:HPP family protein [Streptomyces sp. A1136]THA56613.1 HPP family protein [Streptomyces sp. A1136]